MKNLFLLTTILFLSTSLFAQENETLAGVKVGATIPGTIHAGFLLDHSFNKNFGFGAELLYNQKDLPIKGNTIVFTDAAGSIIVEPSDLKYKLHYLQVPIYFKATFGDKIKPYVNAGLAIGCLLSNSSNMVGKPSYPFYTNGLEWSYLGSVGVDYKPVFIEVRYNASINPAVYSNNGGRINNYYNNNLMISIGVKF